MPDYTAEYEAPATPDYSAEYAAPLDDAENYETALNPAKEEEFQTWKKKHAPKDSGADYDLRGAFMAGLAPDPETGHWPDTFKKPNHPTFSNESRYAAMRPDLAGHWDGDTYVPPGPPDYEKDFQSPEEKFAAGPSHPVEAALDDLKRYARESVVGLGQQWQNASRKGAKIKQKLDELGHILPRAMGMDKPVYAVEIDKDGMPVRVPVFRPLLDRMKEQEDTDTRQSLVQGLAQGQAIVDMARDAKAYETDPNRDSSWHAQGAEMLGSLAPAVAEGPLAPAGVALQMDEAARERALKEGDAPAIAEAKGHLNFVAGVVLSRIPHMPVRARAAAIERVVTRSAQAGTLMFVQDAALQAATENEIDWSQAVKSGAFGTLVGGVLQLPGEVDTVVRARNEPYARAAREFGFKGTSSELDANGRLLTFAREAGFKGKNVGDLIDFVREHNEKVGKWVKGVQAEAAAKAPQPPMVTNLLPEGERAPAAEPPQVPAEPPTPAPEAPGAEILRRAGEAGLPTVPQAEAPRPPVAPEPEPVPVPVEPEPAPMPNKDAEILAARDEILRPQYAQRMLNDPERQPLIKVWDAAWEIVKAHADANKETIIRIPDKTHPKTAVPQSEIEVAEFPDGTWMNRYTYGGGGAHWHGAFPTKWDAVENALNQTQLSPAGRARLELAIQKEHPNAGRSVLPRNDIPKIPTMKGGEPNEFGTYRDEGLTEPAQGFSTKDKVGVVDWTVTQLKNGQWVSGIIHSTGNDFAHYSSMTAEHQWPTRKRAIEAVMQPMIERQKLILKGEAGKAKPKVIGAARDLIAYGQKVLAAADEAPAPRAARKPKAAPAVPVPPAEQPPVPPDAGPVVQAAPAVAQTVSKLVDRKQLKVQKEFLLKAVKAEQTRAPAELPYTQEGQEDLAVLREKDGIEKLSVKYPTAEAVFHRRRGVRTDPTPDHYRTIEAAIQARHAEHVTIVVPGDGTFRVPFSKQHLTEFETRTGKYFGNGMGPLYPAGGYKAPRPTPVPPVPTKADAAAVTAAVALSTSADPTRYALHTVVKDGPFTVATDAKRIIVAMGGGGVKIGEDRIIPGKKDKDGKAVKYPNWRQVFPAMVSFKGGKLSVAKGPLGALDTIVDAGELLRTVTLAAQVTSQKSNSVVLHVLPGGEIGFTAQSPDFGEYATENLSHFDGPRPRIGVDPLYLIDAFKQARMLGAEKVRLIGTDELSPLIVTDGKTFASVIMPVRLQEGEYTSPEPEPSATTEPRTGVEEPSLEEIGDRPGEHALDLFEDATPYEQAYARWQQLRAMEQAGQISAAGLAELDKAETTLGQDFFDHYDELHANGAPGGPLDLLTPSTDSAGKSSVFESAATSFLDSRDVQGPNARAALGNLIRGIWERKMERQLSFDLGADRALADALKSVRDGDPIPVAPAGQLGAPLGEQQGPATGNGGLVGVGQLRLDATDVVNQFVRDGYLQLVGNTYANIHEFAAAAQILRNPAVETLWVIPYDANGRMLPPFATTSRLPAAVNASTAYGHAVLAHLKKVGAVTFDMTHNHPSKRAKPSDADQRFTRHLSSFLKNNWTGPVPLVFRGHLVLNHGTYAVISPYGDYEMFELPEVLKEPDPHQRAVTQSPYLGRPLATAGDLVQLGYQLQSGQGNVLLNLRGRGETVLGLASVHVSDLTAPDFVERLMEMGRTIGATDAWAYTESPTDATVAAIEALQVRGVISQAAYKHMGVVRLSDRTHLEYSFFGTESDSAPILRVADEGATYADEGEERESPNDGAPFHLVDPDSGATTPINLGHMDMVPAVQMPELVRLTKMLCGTIPSLKNLPGAWGLFAHVPGQWGKIVLNRRVFADWEQATKTLAHEIGHLTDYMDDKHLERGNILGRLASLNGYLAQSLPIRRGWGPPITKDEREAMKKQALKDAGKRPAAGDVEGEKAWKKAARDSYAAQLQAELVKRKLATGAEVKGMPEVVGVGNAHREVKAVSDWWRPWDEANASPHEKSYRNSSKEQYADFISVLFNNPVELKQRAPTAWDLFFHYLDAKPEAKEELHYVWDMIHRGAKAVSAERLEHLNVGFAKGEEVLLAKAEERKARGLGANARTIWSAFKMQHYDIYRPAVEAARAVKAAGKELSWDHDPEFLFDAHPLAENANYRLLNRVAKTVVEPLAALGMDTEELGRFQFFNRLLAEAYGTGDRQDGRRNVANPLGHTPATARQELLAMRYRLGPARMEKLVASARQFSDLMHEVMEMGHKAGLYTDKQMEQATKNKYNYATFAVIDYLMVNGRIPAGIKKQIGTLRDIANPFTATLVKMMTATKLAQHNRAKSVVVKFKTEFFPDTIRRGETKKLFLANGRIKIENVRPPDGWHELVVYNLGKPVTWWVDRSTVDMFESRMPAWAEAISGVMNWTWRNIFYPAFLTYNPAYQLYMNPVRDLQRSYVNLPAGVARRHFIGEQIKASRAAWERMQNEMGPADMQRRRALRALGERRPLTKREAKELSKLDMRALAVEIMVQRGLTTPYESFAHGPAAEDYWTKLLQDYKLLEGEAKPNFFRRYIVGPTGLGGIADKMDQAGMIAEAMPKVAAYKVLTRELGWPAKVAAHYIRNHIGTPNHLKKGSWATFDGMLFPFNNVMGKGFAGDIWQARGKAVGGIPAGRQRFEWWRRMTESVLLPRLLMGLGAAGVLGAALKKQYDAASQYNKANNLMLPLGTTPGGPHGYKGIFIRIPEDETGRVLGGLIHHTVQMAFNNDPLAQSSTTDLMNTLGGSLPGVNPLVTLGNSWMDYANGINPRDGLRNNTVMSENQFNAGGWESLRGMFGYSLDKVGVTNFVRWDKNANTTMEQVVGAAPVLNRMLFITDQGLADQDRRANQLAAQKLAQIRAAMPDNVNMLIAEYNALERIPPQRRSPQNFERLAMLQQWRSQVWLPYEERMKDMPRESWKRQGEFLGQVSKAFENKRR